MVGAEVWTGVGVGVEVEVEVVMVKGSSLWIWWFWWCVLWWFRCFVWCTCSEVYGSGGAPAVTGGGRTSVRGARPR
ncbi:hypothetical protein GCM10018773_19800 [Streptomyces candidus]|nr:hypothetical protein GCM10018773_19800 [Streptomyces candidus]